MLAALNHKRLANQAANLTVHSTLEALYSALTAASYYNGAGRSAGSGSAVKNVAKYQNGGLTEAVYGEFAGTAMAGVKFIFVGQATAAKTPTIASPDTAGALTAGHIAFSIVRNAGAFDSTANAWANAAPFTSGDFPGYWKCAVATSVTNVIAIESQDTLWVVFTGAAGSTVYAAAVGGLWDPDSTSPQASELSGRRIGMMGSGVSVLGTFNNGYPFSLIVDGDPGLQGFLSHNSLNNNPHAGVLNIGTNTLRTVMPEGRLTNRSSGIEPISAGILADGKIARRAIPMYIEAKQTAGDSFAALAIGRLREAQHVSFARCGGRISDAGVDVGHLIATNILSTGDALLLAV